MDGDSRLRASVWEFGRRIVHRGYVVLIGVAGGLLGAFNEFFGGAIKLPPWISWTIIGFSLLIAVVWAFHDLRIERDRRIVSLESENHSVGSADPRYPAISDLLAGSITVALSLSRDGDSVLRDAWEGHTRTLIASAYGESEAVQVFTPDLSAQRVFRGEEIANAPRPLAEPIERIRQLLGRIPSMSIQAGFDPAEATVFDPASYQVEYARPHLEGRDEKHWKCPWCDGEAGLFAGCPDCGAERIDEIAYRKVSAPNASVRPRVAAELEFWLIERIARAELLANQRPVRGDDWYFGAMGRWDVENVQQMAEREALGEDLARDYRKDPDTGWAEGGPRVPLENGRPALGVPLDVAEQERYYGRRLAFLRTTLKGLEQAALAA